MDLSMVSADAWIAGWRAKLPRGSTLTITAQGDGISVQAIGASGATGQNWIANVRLARDGTIDEAMQRLVAQAHDANSETPPVIDDPAARDALEILAAAMTRTQADVRISMRRASLTQRNIEISAHIKGRMSEHDAASWSITRFAEPLSVGEEAINVAAQVVEVTSIIDKRATE